MKLNYKKTFLVGLAFFAIITFWNLYDHIIPLMLKYTFSISDTIAGGVMAVDNILALFMLPIFGALSDRTNTKIGRRMPFIVFGGLAAAATMLLIPLSTKLVSLPLFVVGLGLTLFFMATYRSPAVALMPDVTIKPLRSQGNAVINLMGAVGGILALQFVSIFVPKEVVGEHYNPNYFPVFIACSITIVLATVFLFVFVKEPKLTAEMREETKRLGIEDEKIAQQDSGEAGVALNPAVRRSMGFLLASIALWFMGYNAVSTSFSKYCAERFALSAGESAQVLVVANLVAIISYLPIGYLATKIGRKKCILGGVVILCSVFAIGATFSTFSPLMFVLFALAGVSWAAINVNSYPMVVEMAHGADVGKFTGYYYAASMAAQTVTPIVSGAALQYIGYQTLFPYGASFVALSFVTMLFVKHGDAKPTKPKSKLEAFEAMDD